MKVPKTVTTMAHRIGSQLEARLHKVDLDSLLGAAGLQSIRPARSMTLPLLAAFGAGIALGAVMAPTSGKELRARIGVLLGKAQVGAKSMLAKKGHADNALESDAANTDSPYDKAAKAQSDASSNNGHKKTARMPEPTPS